MQRGLDGTERHPQRLGDLRVGELADREEQQHVALPPGQRGQRSGQPAHDHRGVGALASLPRRQRDVLLLYAIGELSYAEIAEALAMPLGSVRSALHRARTRLRDPLRQSDTTEATS